MDGVKKLVTTENWIRDHGLRARKLTRDHILKRIGFKAASGYVGSLKKSVKSRYSLEMYNSVKDSNGDSIYLTARVEDLLKEEESLQTLIGSLNNRLDWISSGSREKLGVLTEQRVVIIMDSYLPSHAEKPLKTPRQRPKYALVRYEITSFDIIRPPVYLLSFYLLSLSLSLHYLPFRAADTVYSCWGELRDVTKDHIRQSLAFVLSQQPCRMTKRETLVQALNDALRVPCIDGVYVLTHGQPPNLTSHEYPARLVKDSPVPVNTSSFGDVDPVFSSLLTELSANTGGRWHRYTTMKGSESRDTALLQGELSAARDMLAEVTALRLELEHSNEPRMPTVPSTPLSARSERDMSSAEWLANHGLRCASARFYDALAPQAFKHCDKIVRGAEGDSKVVNAKYCQRFAHVKIELVEKMPVNTSSFGDVDPVFSSLLTELSANTGGRWHRYTTMKGSESRDTALLQGELSAARDMLAEVTALRLELEHSNEPRMPTVPSTPLSARSERDMSSAEWLANHGLRCASARFYDALAPQAFKHCDKIVRGAEGDSKVVNAKYCQRFAHVK
eukprot:sb/3463516/